MAGEQILIVDDNIQNLKLTRLLLTLEGYEVHTVEDAESALAMLERLAPRLIVMDIQLPGLDGLALTRRLKADRRTRDILVIAHTAYAMKGDREAALAAGCDGYIPKPVDTETFAKLIAEYLGRDPAAGTTA